MPAAQIGLATEEHDVVDWRSAGWPAQITEVKFDAVPEVSSVTEAVTLKHPVVAYGASAGPVSDAAAFPHRKVTVCAWPIALNASFGDALTMQSVGVTA